jgi:hypothetical protein
MLHTFPAVSRTETSPLATRRAALETGVVSGFLPAMRRGMCLYSDDPDDPWVFRVEIPEYGKHYRVVFTRPEGGEMRLRMEVLSFRKRPDVRNPRPWVTGALAVGAARGDSTAAKPAPPAPRRGRRRVLDALRAARSTPLDERRAP